MSRISEVGNGSLFPGGWEGDAGQSDFGTYGPANEAEMKLFAAYDIDENILEEAEAAIPEEWWTPETISITPHPAELISQKLAELENGPLQATYRSLEVSPSKRYHYILLSIRRAASE